MASIFARLEGLKYRWAYRVVDSRAFGLPQRRRRVFIVATQHGDPRDVLLADDAPDQQWPAVDLTHPAGFYWTEGRTGHGLTADAIPPLKAGSALGIPSPPAVRLPNGRVVTPTIEAVERMQGFPPGWTSGCSEKAMRRRWRLLGNAVSVPVAAWIGRRLLAQKPYNACGDSPLAHGSRWPPAGWCVDGVRMAATTVSEYPVRARRGRLSAFATQHWPDLSTRALAGFVRRAREGRLRYPDGFVEALQRNLDGRCVSDAVADDGCAPPTANKRT